MFGLCNNLFAVIICVYLNVMWFMLFVVVGLSKSLPKREKIWCPTFDSCDDSISNICFSLTISTHIVCVILSKVFILPSEDLG